LVRVALHGPVALIGGPAPEARHEQPQPEARQVGQGRVALRLHAQRDPPAVVGPPEAVYLHYVAEAHRAERDMGPQLEGGAVPPPPESLGPLDDPVIAGPLPILPDVAVVVRGRAPDVE